MTRFSVETDRALRDAGWVPGRRIDIANWVLPLADEGFRVHEAAEQFLAEFGGLTVNVSGPGLTAAREPFSFYPMSCSGEEDRISEWGLELGRNFFPLGELGHRRFLLVIDEAGEVYLMMDWVATLGDADHAIESLVRGMSAKQIAE